MTYKNNIYLYCGDGDINAFMVGENKTMNFTEASGWANVSFYRIQNFNTSSQQIEKMPSDPKKYSIDDTANVLTLKTISLLIFFFFKKLK